MSITEEIIAALRQAGVDARVGAGSALLRGWDYWVAGSAPTEGRGVARTPHPFVSGRVTLPDGALAVVDPSHTPVQLLAGVWRQCLIRPGDRHASLGRDPFAVSDIDADCASSSHLVALLGHQPRDLALYLDSLRQRDPSLFALVLAKRFREAIEHDPDVLVEAWPHNIQSRWSEAEGDYLPPFLVAVLYAELARLALNQAGLLELSFDGGVELTTKQFLERVKVSSGAAAGKAVQRAIAYAPFQSVALGLPDQIVRNGDWEAARAWVRTAASGIALTAAIRGDIDIAPGTPGEAKFLHAGFAVHPAFAPEPRKDKGYSLQPHRAATFWGLNARRNAAVRLLEIGLSARAWNQRYRPGGPALPDATNYRTASPVACAIATVRFRWFAEHDPAAGLRLLGEVLSPDDKKEHGFDRWTPGTVTPLTIDDHLGDKSGLTLLQETWKHYRQLPRPGAFGYTARSQAHLWLDDEGDDLAHYRLLQQDARLGHAAALAGHLPAALQDTARVPPEIVALLGRQHGIKRRRDRRPPEMTSHDTPARGAQQLGLMISALSTDPAIAKLLRDRGSFASAPR